MLWNASHRIILSPDWTSPSARRQLGAKMYAYDAAGRFFVVAVLDGHSQPFLPPSNIPSRHSMPIGIQHGDIICDANENNEAFFGSEVFQ
jgi:hypothetical protein